MTTTTGRRGWISLAAVLAGIGYLLLISTLVATHAVYLVVAIPAAIGSILLAAVMWFIAVLRDARSRGAI